MQEQHIIDRLFMHGDATLLNAFIKNRHNMQPGMYAYGCGPHDRKYRYNELFSAIQGMYCTKHAAPEAEKGSRWIGFYRVCLWPHERAVVEFGFPGPRIRRYSPAQWNEISACIRPTKTGEAVFEPQSGGQVESVQELVAWGYLSPCGSVE